MNMLSLSRVSALLLASLLGLASPASAANPLDPIDDDDREALEAIAMYPEDVREQALLVASEPAKLVELQKLQEKSQDDFRDLIGPYSQDEQQDFFELSRYPDLVEAIASGGPKSREDLERIAADYPEETRAAALRQSGERQHVVSRIHALLADFDGRFGHLVEDLPGDRQQAFRAMLRTPELLSLMAEHMGMTVLLGDAYERDAGDLRDALANLNLEIAKRNVAEADDWKSKVESDPDLRRDYDAAARDYERQTGYSAYQAPSRPVVSVNISPYPYWVGYPWWYPVAYDYYDPWYWWYPRPYWGHCGYGYGPRVVLYGGPIWRPWFPTFAFTSWYFSFGDHHHHYPYLSDRFYSYYWDDWDDWDRRHDHDHDRHRHHDVHRRVVQKFVYRTDVVMPANYFHAKNRRERVERFREFGRIAPAVQDRMKAERNKEFASAGRGRHVRPGRDFDIDDGGKSAEVGRAEARRLVAKSPKEFPELSKATKEDWERPRGRGRGGEAVGGLEPGGAGGAVKGRGKEKGSAALPSAGGDEGGRGRGRERDAGKGGGAKPSLGGTEEGTGRSKGREVQQGDQSPGGGKGSQGRSESGKATPTFEPPSDQGGGAGGRSKGRGVTGGESPSGGKSRKGGAESGKTTPSFEGPSDQGGGAGGRSKGRGVTGGESSSGSKSRKGGSESGKATPSFQGPADSGSGGSGGRSRGTERGGDSGQGERSGGGKGSSKGSSQPSFTAPEGNSQGSSRSRDVEPRGRSYEAPKYEAPRAKETPRVDRSGGGRDRSGEGGSQQQGGGGQGGGGQGDGGHGKKKNQNQDDDPDSGSGGGRGRHR